MRIIRTNKNAAAATLNRQRANAGCNICPCCGETHSSLEYMQKGIMDSGIVSGFLRRIYYGPFGAKYADVYSCKTCGAEWESEKYRG